MPIEFRSAAGAEAAAIAALVNRAYRPAGQGPGWTHEAHLVEGDRISAAGVQALLVPGSVVLVAIAAGVLVGCVHIESRSHEAYIGMLATEPARQAQGLGRQLLWQAERWARKHFGATGLRISVLEARTDLLAYYERRGYALTGESEPFHASCGVGELRVPGLRVLVMAKRVPPWWRRALHSSWASLRAAHARGHFLALAGLLLAGTATAAVQTAPNGFVIHIELAIDAAPAKTYAALVGEVSQWWNPEHTYSNDSHNLVIDARPGGCFCERLPGGGGVEHMRIVYLAPPQVLRMSGALGPMQGSGLAGALTFKLSPAGTGTKLELSYVVGGYMEGGFEKMGPAAEGMLAEQAGRLKRYVETGKPS